MDRIGTRTLLGLADRLLPAHVRAEDSRERMRQRLLVCFGVLFVVFTAPWYVAMFMLDPVVRLPRMTALLVMALLGGAPFWLRILSTRQVAWGTVMLLHVAIVVNVVLNQGLQGPVALILTCLPVLTAVLLGSRLGWLDFGLVVLTGAALEYLALKESLPMTAPPEIWALSRVMSLTIGVALTLTAVSAFLRLTGAQAVELQRMAHHDGLTGLFNRHFVAEVVPSEISRVERRRAADPRTGASGPCLGFILVDLDFFKRVNDTWGHSVGDEVLKTVGETISQATRSGDIVARWGGEEYFIVLRDLDVENLSETPRRILEAVRSQSIEVAKGETVRLTCSLGFTHLPFGSFGARVPFEDLVKLAGLALLEAKQGGRDREVGLLWNREVDSAEDVERIVADVPEAIRLGWLDRCELSETGERDSANLAQA